jgi:hypothetical protein
MFEISQIEINHEKIREEMFSNFTNEHFEEVKKSHPLVIVRGIKNYKDSL